MAVWALSSEVCGAEKTDGKYEIRLYLEDHEITTGDALGVAVRLENRSAETRSIRSGISFRRVMAPTTQSADLDASRNQGERLQDEMVAPQHAIDPWIAVVIEGPFPSVNRPWLTIRSELLTTLHLEQNQDVTTTNSTPSNVFAAGEYTVRAVLYDGSKELASSKSHRLQVKQETFES